MNKQIAATLVMTLFLAACASKTVKEEPAKVEDRSGSTQTAPAASGQDSASNGADASGAASSGISGKQLGINPLKDPSNILSKRSVYFEFDKDEVKAEYRPMVEAHAKYLMQNPSAKVVVQGNADERGSREYNLSLGQRRAVAVKKVMNLVGANDKQIETVSLGEEKPKATGHDEASYSQNRRADFAYEGE